MSRRQLGAWVGGEWRKRWVVIWAGELGQRGVEEERIKNEREKRRAVAWGLGRQRVEEEMS